MLGPVLNSVMGVQKRCRVCTREFSCGGRTHDGKKPKPVVYGFPQTCVGGQERGRPKFKSVSPTRQDLLMRNVCLGEMIALQWVLDEKTLAESPEAWG